MCLASLTTPDQPEVPVPAVTGQYVSTYNDTAAQQMYPCGCHFDAILALQTPAWVLNDAVACPGLTASDRAGCQASKVARMCVAVDQLVLAVQVQCAE